MRRPPREPDRSRSPFIVREYRHVQEEKVPMTSNRFLVPSTIDIHTYIHTQDEGETERRERNIFPPLRRRSGSSQGL